MIRLIWQISVCGPLAGQVTIATGVNRVKQMPVGISVTLTLWKNCSQSTDPVVLL